VRSVAKKRDLHDDTRCNTVKHVCDELNAEVGSLQKNTRFASLRDVVKKVCHTMHSTVTEYMSRQLMYCFALSRVASYRRLGRNVPVLSRYKIKMPT